MVLVLERVNSPKSSLVRTARTLSGSVLSARSGSSGPTRANEVEYLVNSTLINRVDGINVSLLIWACRV